MAPRFFMEQIILVSNQVAEPYLRQTFNFGGRGCKIELYRPSPTLTFFMTVQLQSCPRLSATRRFLLFYSKHLAINGGGNFFLLKMFPSYWFFKENFSFPNCSFKYKDRTTTHLPITAYNPAGLELKQVLNISCFSYKVTNWAVLRMTPQKSRPSITADVAR